MQQPPARKSKSKHGCQHDEDDSSRSSPVQQVYKPIRGHRPPPYITVAAGFLILARQRVSEASTSPRLIKSASDRNMLPPFLNITYRESSWSRADESCERRFLNCGVSCTGTKIGSQVPLGNYLGQTSWRDFPLPNEAEN